LSRNSEEEECSSSRSYGFGIGPVTGVRVLRKSLSHEEFMKNIYVAEKTYVTSWGFWDN